MKFEEELQETSEALTNTRKAETELRAKVKAQSAQIETLKKETADLTKCASKSSKTMEKYYDDHKQLSLLLDNTKKELAAREAEIKATTAELHAERERQKQWEE